MLRLIFVCSGNICRSPMAAAIARDLAEHHGQEVVVISCGTLGIVGQPAAENARRAVAEIGLDLQSHYSQGVSRGFIEHADHVFVMAPKHESRLRQMVPSLGKRVVRTWEWSSEPITQIDDPVGKDLDAFRVCRDRLLECIEAWFAAQRNADA